MNIRSLPIDIYQKQKKTYQIRNDKFILQILQLNSICNLDVLHIGFSNLKLVSVSALIRIITYLGLANVSVGSLTVNHIIVP